MGRLKKTTEEFIEEVRGLEGDHYEVLGEYKGKEYLIEMKHVKCGNEYEVRPSRFLSGRRCPHCFANKSKSNKEFSKEVSKLTNSDFSHIGNYINAKTKTRFKFNLNNYEFDMTPNRFLSGGYKTILTQMSDNLDVHTKLNGDFKFISKTRKTFIYEHSICKVQCEYSDQLTSSSKCPICEDRKQFKKISNILDRGYVSFHRKVVIKGSEQPLHIFIPDSNIAIEYRGLMYFNPHLGNQIYKTQRSQGRMKERACVDNNIHLLVITSYDINNIPHIIRSLVNYIKSKKKINKNSFSVWKKSLNLKNVRNIKENI